MSYQVLARSAHTHTQVSLLIISEKMGFKISFESFKRLARNSCLWFFIAFDPQYNRYITANYFRLYKILAELPSNLQFLSFSLV